MRILHFLLALLTSLPIFAQVDAPTVQVDRELEAAISDSIRRHEDFGAILHYQPHRCRNRYGRFGWVDKYHKGVIPFEYQEFPEHLSSFNPAKKGGNYGAVDAKGKVIVPFKYSSLSPYYKQRLVICRDRSYKVTVFDFEGRVVIPEEKLYNIWLFNDSTLAVQDFSKKDVRTYDLQGRHIKTWAYSHIYHFSSGRILASRDTLMGLGMATTQGIIDPGGKVLVPLEYTSIEWEKGDWARVANYKTKTGGLFQISTQTLHPDKYYKVLPPDPLGNFTFWDGASMGNTRVGLMDAQFKVIFPPTYLDIRFLDENGHYALHAGRNNRGYLRGVGNVQGQVVMDTTLLGFEPVVYEKKIGQNERGQWIMAYDTLPFFVFEDALSGKKGLWHRQAGQLRAAAFDRMEAVTDTTFIQEKGDTSFLFHIDGRPLAGPYYRIWRGRIDDYLLARPNWNDEYILLALDGRFIRRLEGEPRLLADGIYIMGRYGNKTSGYSKVKEYGLFDRNLNPITGLVFDAEPKSMDGLNTQQKIRVLNRAHPAGYGRWVGYMREGLEETLILIDDTGKTFEIKAE